MKPIQRVKSWNKGAKNEQDGESSYISPSRYKMAPYLTIYFTRTETISSEGSLTATLTVTASVSASVSASITDPYYSSVTLLLPMNGTNGSTTFTDYSSAHNTITVNGNTQITTAQSKWGGSSGVFDGTTDWLYAPVGTTNFGTGNFTIEGWFRWASLTNGGLFHVYPGTPVNTTAGVAVGYDGTDFQIFTGSANYARTYTPTVGSWYHVALVRNSSSLTLYVNGVAQGASLSDSANYGGNGINIGLYYASAYTSNTNMNDFRVTVGVARYTANFTPPTASFPLS